MEHRYKNQKDACLAYLEEHDSITPLEALHEFGCFRLAAVIARLRDEGHIIRTDIAEGEKKYAIYTLMKEGVEYDG
jgi:hypothetical protein